LDRKKAWSHAWIKERRAFCLHHSLQSVQERGSSTTAKLAVFEVSSHLFFCSKITLAIAQPLCPQLFLNMMQWGLAFFRAKAQRLKNVEKTRELPQKRQDLLSSKTLFLARFAKNGANKKPVSL